jgi:hypothetical protein
MGLAKIAEIDGVLCVKQDGFKWRRVNGQWQMLSAKGNWFACEIQNPLIRRQVEDYECCLRPYDADEGPEYPRDRKGYNVAQFFQALQQKELATATKRIFAPVREKYDAAAENRARFKRDYSYARLFRPGAYQDHLTK